MRFLVCKSERLELPLAAHGLARDEDLAVDLGELAQNLLELCILPLQLRALLTFPQSRETGNSVGKGKRLSIFAKSWARSSSSDCMYLSPKRMRFV